VNRKKHVESRLSFEPVTLGPNTDTKKTTTIIHNPEANKVSSLSFRFGYVSYNASEKYASKVSKVTRQYKETSEGAETEAIVFV